MADHNSYISQLVTCSLYFFYIFSFLQILLTGLWVPPLIHSDTAESSATGHTHTHTHTHTHNGQFTKPPNELKRSN